jgi:hypothetical protein
MIFHEPSEGMAGTKLPESFFIHSTPVINLERHTGADILISPYDTPLPDKLSTPNLIPPHRIALEKHCKAGILIQRKSGTDFFNSIPDLAEIEARMLEWSVNPWLLTTEVEERGGQYYVDGNLMSRWRWSSVCGAERHWQHRGGSIARLSSGNIITEWVLACEKDCKKWLEEPGRVLAHKVPRQKVVKEERMRGPGGLEQRRSGRWLSISPRGGASLRLWRMRYHWHVQMK